MALLTKVAIGCGPTIYELDTSRVAGGDRSEFEPSAPASSSASSASRTGPN